MPILDIEIVATNHWSPPAELATRLANAIGAALGAESNRVWVKLHIIPSSAYAENGGANQRAEADDSLPVFVHMLHAHPPVGDARRDEIERLTAAVAVALSRPRDRVHILYAPAGAGRVAFGGTLIE